ncbi:MAG: 4-(cytidine 5'-diphospho)-2-C-methyl-D-erythritol kinase [Gammaproteobacteria bacterium]|nr:4-(cytidine 5'-diphospho)-2-C-methyl-D-erythritol kinase [Gammaproteobacteria bacterium]
MTDASRRTWPAPAKINLFLHVTGRRPDGYHDLQTLFQLLDWGDEVSITPTRAPSISRTGADYGVPEDEDLVVRAARLLQRETASRSGAILEVHKRVPMGAGLGGGSSDAATVLVVLNRLWGCDLDTDHLAALGARLGADVPVFVRGRSALATGVGEQLSAVTLGERHYVLVLPGIVIPTQRVFDDPQLRRHSQPIDLSDYWEGAGRNDCEPVVRQQFPEVDETFRKLAAWGRPRLTGTGSALFLEAGSSAKAQATARAIKTLYNSRAVRGVDRSPLHRMLLSDGV